MRFFRTLLEPGGRFLARHLRHLCDQLQNLTVRVRESVASAAGQSVAGVVREVVRNLLDDHKPDQSHSFGYSESGEHFDQGWERYEPARNGTRYSDDLDYMERQQDQWEDEFSTAVQDSTSARPSWLHPFAVGLQAVSYCLGRRGRQFPIVVAIGCGFAAALITYTCSPLVLAGAGLLSLMGIVQSVPTTLAHFGIG